MEIISRDQAETLGLLRYYTAIPCRNGHLSERNVNSGQCLACTNANVAAMRDRDPELISRREQRAALIDHYQAGNPKVVTREEAREKGLSHYYTGIPCINGHISERTTKGKQCLECHREHMQRLRKENPERTKEIKAADYAKHRDKRLSTVAAYQEQNKETIRKKSKVFRDANKPMIAARYKAWSKENRPLLRIHERRRRDRERGATGSHTFAEVKAMEIAQGMLCANRFCRTDLSAGYHQDHILPIVLGGTDDIANIQLLCGPCNLSKGDLHPDEWQKRLEEAHQPVPQMPPAAPPYGD